MEVGRLADVLQRRAEREAARGRQFLGSTSRSCRARAQAVHRAASMSIQACRSCLAELDRQRQADVAQPDHGDPCPVGVQHSPLLPQAVPAAHEPISSRRCMPAQLSAAIGGAPAPVAGRPPAAVWHPARAATGTGQTAARGKQIGRGEAPPAVRPVVPGVGIEPT